MTTYKVAARFVCLLSIFCTPLFASAQLLNLPPQQPEVAPGYFNVKIPYSVVDYWNVHRGITYPSSFKKYPLAVGKIVQYFLITNGFDIPPTGYVGSSTKAALRQYQAGVDDSILPETKQKIDDLMAYLYCPTTADSPFDTDYRLENVNRPQVLPKDFIPRNLTLDRTNAIPAYGYSCLEKETAENLSAMYASAKSDGVPLYLTSTYRSKQSQQYLLDVMINRLGAYAYKIVATPGQSEHNLGTAFDVAGLDGGRQVSVSAGRQFAWLKKNAARFGFVNSYPVGKEAITGFLPEPWHWRYVGSPVASTIEKSGLTLGEFLDTYHDRLAKTAGVATPVRTFAPLSTITIGG